MTDLTITDLFMYRNELGQTFRELLAEHIRAQGIAWNRANPEMFGWRDKPWMDGIRVDLDEEDQVEYLVKGVTEVIREAAGPEFWSRLSAAYLDAQIAATDDTAPPATNTPARRGSEGES